VFKTKAFAQTAAVQRISQRARAYMASVRSSWPGTIRHLRQKWFKFHRDLKLQLRAEMFNALNKGELLRARWQPYDSAFGNKLRLPFLHAIFNFGLKLYW